MHYSQDGCPWYRPTFVPALSGVSISALVVIRGLLLGDTLHFLPIPMTLFTMLNLICFLMILWTVETGTSYCLHVVAFAFSMGMHETLTYVDPNWIHSSEPWWPVTENDQNTLANIPVCLSMGGQTGILANNYLYFIACDYFWPQKLGFLQNSSWLWHSHANASLVGANAQKYCVPPSFNLQKLICYSANANYSHNLERI